MPGRLGERMRCGMSRELEHMEGELWERKSVVSILRQWLKNSKTEDVERIQKDIARHKEAIEYLKAEIKKEKAKP
jgi:cell division protein FtsB